MWIRIAIHNHKQLCTVTSNYTFSFSIVWHRVIGFGVRIRNTYEEIMNQRTVEQQRERERWEKHLNTQSNVRNKMWNTHEIVRQTMSNVWEIIKTVELQMKIRTKEFKHESPSYRWPKFIHDAYGHLCIHLAISIHGDIFIHLYRCSYRFIHWMYRSLLMYWLFGRFWLSLF